MLEAGIVAPPGPVSAEALKFTLDKPPAGPCTITCVSTVSPRPLNRVIDKLEPAASVCPPLTRLDMTHAGKEALDCRPLPDSATTVGELYALLANEILPDALPAADGTNCTGRLLDCPGARANGKVRPVKANAVPLMVPCETVMFAEPEFVRVTGWELVLPTITFPKLTSLGVAES